MKIQIVLINSVHSSVTFYSKFELSSTGQQLTTKKRRVTRYHSGIKQKSQNYILALGSVCFRKRQFPLVAKRHIKMNYFLLFIMKNLLFSLIYFLSIWDLMTISSRFSTNSFPTNRHAYFCILQCILDFTIFAVNVKNK